VYFHVLLVMGRQEGSPRNVVPRVKRPQSPGEYDYRFAPVRWEAAYVTRDDTVTGESGVLVFTDLDKATFYTGTMIADGEDIAIVVASDEQIQKHAFGGDLDGVCIVDPAWTQGGSSLFFPLHVGPHFVRPVAGALRGLGLPHAAFTNDMKHASSEVARYPPVSYAQE
jgi:hypothetical protein